MTACGTRSAPCTRTTGGASAIGMRMLLAVTLGLMLLMFLAEGNKVFTLMLWILSMFAVAAYLIAVEYADYELQKKLEDITQMEQESMGALLELPELPQYATAGRRCGTAASGRKRLTREREPRRRRRRRSRKACRRSRWYTPWHDMLQAMQQPAGRDGLCAQARLREPAARECAGGGDSSVARRVRTAAPPCG